MITDKKNNLTIEKIEDIIRDDVCSMCPACNPAHKERCYTAYRRQAVKIFEQIIEGTQNA